jgi:hypothetical protein
MSSNVGITRSASSGANSLAEGDISFQRNCYDRMRDLIYRQGRTIPFVSHNVKEIEHLSNRVLLLDCGRVSALGEPPAVCDVQFDQSHRKIREQGGADRLNTHVQASGEVALESIELLDTVGATPDAAEYGKLCTFRINPLLNAPIDHLEIELGIHTMDSPWLATCTALTTLPLPHVRGASRLRLPPSADAVPSRRVRCPHEYRWRL